MTVERLCFCTASFRGPFIVQVRNGNVASVETLEGVPATGNGLGDVSALTVSGTFDLTVPGIFDLIGRSFDSDRLEVQFNQQNGVPTLVQIDRIALAVDDELTVRVSSFRVDN